jgi:hypothetical protein
MWYALTENSAGLHVHLGLGWMSYTEADARQRMLDMLARATDHLARALASLSGAYEQLGEAEGDRLEEQLFRPVQRAYGRARATHASFAERYGLPKREFETPVSEAPSTGVRGFVDHAVEAVGAADTAIAELQDSLMPIEVGDAQLRAGLMEVRQLLDGLPEQARRFVSEHGR